MPVSPHEDLAVVPFVERLTAFLLERGLGYPYFRRCRTRLLDVREASLRRFLDGLAALPGDHGLDSKQRQR